MRSVFKRITCIALSALMLLCMIPGAAGSNPQANVPGDVNRDGKVNNKDVIALFHRVSDETFDADDVACDCDGNGEINNKDVLTLFRYVCGLEDGISYGVPQQRPVLDNVFTEWGSSVSSTVKNPKQTTVSVTDKGIQLTFNKISPTVDPYVVFDVAEYERIKNKPELKGEYGAYVMLRVESTADDFTELFTHSPAGGDSASTRYICDGKDRFMLIDMTQTTLTQPDKLTTIRIDWAGGNAANGATMLIKEIGFFKDKESALGYIGLTEDEMRGERALTAGFDKYGDASLYAKSSNAELSLTSDLGVNSLVVRSQNKTPSITLDLGAMAGAGRYLKRGRYLALKFKVSGLTESNVTVSNVTDIAGLSAGVSQKAQADCTNDGWQGAMFDLRDAVLYVDELRKLSVSFSGFNPNASVTILSVTVSDDINDALRACGHEEYCLNYDNYESDNDPLADTVLTAEYEDPTVDLWFDHVTEKTLRTDTESTGRTGYTVKMAKNESENCQFFVSVRKDSKIAIEVDPFEDANGDTVPFELCYEYYHNIKGSLIPDALPPYTGAVDVKADNSQGFMIRFTTLPGTPAGLYESVIHVRDGETGKEIKRAAVAVKVWDFELSEKTELRTAFLMWWYPYILDSYNLEATGFTQQQLFDNYFEFFLKYRINIIDNPHGLTSSYANNYMKQARVNTARWTYLDMSIAEDNGGVTPEWIDKVIYYNVDEPSTKQQFQDLLSSTERIKSNTPDYKLVCPFDRDLNLLADGTTTTFDKATMDQIEYMSQAVNIWCPKLDAFTTRDLGFVSRASFIQSKEQDAKYGTFIERMREKVAAGDELWAYVCINPIEPYANWQLMSDGTETIISVWQLKEYDITGLLYWAVDYWKVNYWDTENPWSGSAYGDGILIYSGYKFGLPYPVSTVRLETLRDGIEDYQMLCMLEETLGKEAAQDIIRKVTTSVVTYTANDDHLHAVRVLLGDTLDAALNH